MKYIFLLAVFIISFAFTSSVLATDMKKIELLSVKASSLIELQRKVAGRDDVSSEKLENGLIRYLISDRYEAYYFTSEENEAHPTAIFRGKVKRDDGSMGFDQRAWSATDNKEALMSLLENLEAKGFKEL